MSISQRDAPPKETVTVKRSWPTWETSPRQGKDAIITEISNLFWVSAGEAISCLISDTIDVAKRAGIDVTPLSKKSISKSSNSSQPFSPTDEERAFTHVARCLLQAAGFFDLNVLLEDRGLGERIGTPIEALDWIFSRDVLRFTTRGLLHWGNAHGSIVWGPLKFETGVKTEDNLVSGVLITARYNPAGKRAALRLVPVDGDPNPLRMDATDLERIPVDTESRIRAFPVFAMVKEVIDMLFVQVNKKDHYTEVVLDVFVEQTLKYHHDKFVKRLRPIGLEKSRVVCASQVVETWKDHQKSKAFEKLVKDEVGVFVDLIWAKPDTVRWRAMIQNCQHFCTDVLQSKCFLRVDGHDRAGPLTAVPGGPEGLKTYQSSLPSVSKVFTLVDDTTPKITPAFADYFSSIQRSKEGVTMISFKEDEIKGTLQSQPERSSLLDLRKFGIPVLPNTVEYSKVNQRLGVRPNEPNDAWFALSAASLYFVATSDPLSQITKRLEKNSRLSGLGMLSLGIFEWLEKAADPRLANSIMFSAMKGLTEAERAAIKDDRKYDEMLQKAIKKLQKAEASKKTEKIEEAEQQFLAIKACRDFLVDVPKVRARQRGSWNFLSALT
ncbi:hypothetical protein EDD85DRAFT_784890 [Armillaria nabsnona]|nr:hypothetical protein EDD85DRAFT_784890 [Armillaria nabsnona]